MSNGGKGDGSRPFSVPWEQFASDYERIFGKPQKLCGLCRKPADKCACCPTDDGPGQEGDNLKGNEP